MSELIKPFCKWAGGKFRVLDRITKHLPPANRYFEPFVGAGSVVLNVEYPSYIINDCNKDLIAVWKSIQQLGNDFINECESLFSGNNTEEKFFLLRGEFNQTKDSLRKASLFIYLNRHCFNGLCRYNSKGEFNVPFGRYEKPYFPRVELEGCLDKVRKFDIYNKDFREIFQMVKCGDVIYCDPPYIPLSETSNFDSYSAGGFSLRDQLDLADCAERAASIGATVVISNHYNWTASEIYAGASKIEKIDVSRTISSDVENRKPVKELIAIYKPRKKVA